MSSQHKLSLQGGEKIMKNSPTRMCMGCGNGILYPGHGPVKCIHCLIEDEWKKHSEMDEDAIEEFVRRKYRTL